ncbi:MAG TPA: nucleotidyltransferase family protein [Hyphomicrobiaceae bacterium]|nr:nucleotidyltransferase family protein [Hyphomicrobiaceae bacterium]
MSSFTAHEALAGTGESWLIHFADPVRRMSAPSGLPDTAQIGTLLAAAESHGVLPAVVRALGALLESRGHRAGGDRDVAAALEAAKLKLAYQTGFGMLLSHHAAKAMQAFSVAGVTGTIVKGATVARHLYPDPSLRTFTDVDILVSEDQRDGAAKVMRGLGFELFEFEDRRGKDYHEQKWLLPGQHNVMIEVHSNLVHSPKLRGGEGGMSVRYEDVIAAGDGDSNAPTALLLVAAAHAAVGHQFDRLQHLVDVVQAARGAAGVVDHRRLADASRRCGVALAIAAALDLAGRTFREAAATELAHLMMPGRLHRLPCLMLSPALVLRAQSKARARGSWRRKLFRQALRIA